MKTVTYSAIKGGVGKSSLSIITANMLAKAGYRTLVIDMDIQNSATFYYLEDPSIIDQKNIALALQEKDLLNHVSETVIPKVDIIPSSFFLVDFRAVSEHRLKQLLPELAPHYDYCIIDTAPTYDNLVLNAIQASDLIISPVQLSQFNYKGALFYSEKLASETDKLGNWQILINSYTGTRSQNQNSLTNQYLDLFHSSFDNILPVLIPRSSTIQKYIDTHETISLATRKKSLFLSIRGLAEHITGETLDSIKRI